VVRPYGILGGAFLSQPRRSVLNTSVKLRKLPGCDWSSCYLLHCLRQWQALVRALGSCSASSRGRR